MNRVVRTLLNAGLLIGVLGGCSPAAPTDGGKITVFAAASLKKAFSDIGAQFATDNPGTEVEFSFAGSADLVTQLTHGAPADVFAAADSNNMGRVEQAGLLAGPAVNFASNTLTIVVAPGNPQKITTFADLTRPDLSVVVCAPQVPCGSATRKIEQATGVQVTPVSEETQVTDVLDKVRTGQADAGIVYVTDALGAADQVTAVAIPESAGAANTYPVAVLAQAQDPELARRFVDLVTGAAGRKILAAAGFAQP